MHAIQVDDEVMAFLRSNAEPFVDTPNTVLRRELLARRPAVPGRVPRQSISGGPVRTDSAAIAMPEALRQILEVVELVRTHDRTRNEATVEVARRHQIRRETVADKYGRQLDLNTTGFDMLMGEPHLKGLRQRLIAKFPQFRLQVERALDEFVRS